MSTQVAHHKLIVGCGEHFRSSGALLLRAKMAGNAATGESMPTPISELWGSEE